MQVFIHQLDGSVATADPAQFDSLQGLLASLNAEECRAVCQGSNIDSLDGLFPNANVYLTADLSGGKRKRKKKVYTTKKKNKHIHKKIKMGIYTLYAVDSNSSTIQRRAKSLKTERPAPHADQVSSWASTGTDIIAVSATPPSRWTLKQSRRTKKS